MSLSLLNQTVVVRLRPAAPLSYDELGEPDYGDPATDWTEVSVSGCSVQPASTSERLTLAEATTDTWTLRGPVDMPLAATSQVVCEGVAYAVSGEPQRWASPLNLNHTEAPLTEWRG